MISAPSAFSNSAPFDRHAFWHRDLQAIASRRAHVRQSNAGVSARRFNNDGLFVDLSLAFRSVDHRSTNTVLDTPQRIHVFDLGDDCSRTPLGDAAQSYERCVANALGNIIMDSGVAECRHNLPFA